MTAKKGEWELENGERVELTRRFKDWRGVWMWEGKFLSGDWRGNDWALEEDGGKGSDEWDDLNLMKCVRGKKKRKGKK